MARTPSAGWMVRRAAPVALGLAGIGGLAMVVDPRAMAAALGHFDTWTLVPMVVLILTFYLLQGLRWHLLLRAVGARASATDHELMNLAGQALTAVLPLGDLTRALLASRASGVAFGATAATVTVQELTFTLLLVGAAGPGLAHLPGGFACLLVVVAGIAAVVAILTVPSLSAFTLRCVASTPGLRRFASDVDTMGREVGHLLRRPGVVAGAALDLARVVCATGAFLLALRGLHVDSIGWWDASLVLAASFVGGALSLLPGGAGANEAGVAGMLVLLGVHPAAAAAAALVQRMSLTLVPAAGGAMAYVALRRRGSARRAHHPGGAASVAAAPMRAAHAETVLAAV